MVLLEAWFANLPDVVKWTFDGCGVAVLGLIAKWCVGRLRHDAQPTITQSPSVVQSPSIVQAPVVNVNPPPTLPAVYSPSREERACDAIAVAAYDVADSARNFHNVVTPDALAHGGEIFAMARTDLQSQLRKWYDVVKHHNHHVRDDVAAAAADVIYRAGQILHGALDRRRKTDPEFEADYADLPRLMSLALVTMQAEMRRCTLKAAS
jgi:hypothetical protein